MISKVLTYKGQTINPSDLFNQLIAIQPANSIFPVQKALGSIGGAVASGFIEKKSNGNYERMR